MILHMWTMLIIQAYSPFTAPHCAVGFGILSGATKVARLFCDFFTSSLSTLWWAGRGSRKARRCSIGIPTSFRPATLFGISLVGFNLLTGASKMTAITLCARENRAIERAINIIERTFSKPEAPSFTNQNIAKNYFQFRLATLEHEEFHALWLDAQNRLIAAQVISIGTITQTSVYPREVLKSAIHHNACSVIFAHNHPTGKPEPSIADKVLTSTLKQALSLIDVRLLDHIIIAGALNYSFSEMGLIHD